MMSKCQTGENYVWVRKQKKALWFFSGATGLPLCWWSQRAPHGPIIIWTLWTGGSECEREKSYVCVQRSAWACPNVYKSISVDRVPNGHWLQSQASVDWQRLRWTSHNLLQWRDKERHKRLQRTWWKIIYKNIKIIYHCRRLRLNMGV